MTKSEHENWEQEMSKQFNVMMDGIRTQQMPKDSLERSLQAAEAITMTQAAHKRGFTNMIITAAILFPVMYVIAYGIRRWLNVSWPEGFFVVCVGVAAVAFPVQIVSRLLGSALRGTVLMDCGPFPARRRFLVILPITLVAGVGLSIAGVVSLLTNVGGEAAFYCFMFAVPSFMFAWISFFCASGRLLICENGLFLYWGLLRWNKVESYRWEGTNDATLMLQVKGRFAPFRRAATPVAKEQKEAVEALLQKHVGS